MSTSTGRSRPLAEAAPVRPCTQGAGAPLWTQARAIFLKDVRSELRNRSALNSILLFSLTATVVVGFAAGAVGVATSVKAALLWVVLFFAAFSGLAHVFIHEEETGTTTALRLTASPGAVLSGKLLFNLALLGAISLVVVPVYMAVMDVRPASPAGFAAAVIAGGFALASAATIVGAIIAKARGKGALYGALGFPIILPLLFMAVKTTRDTLQASTEPSVLAQGITGLVSFGVMIVAASVLCFPVVWED